LTDKIKALINKSVEEKLIGSNNKIQIIQKTIIAIKKWICQK